MAMIKAFFAASVLASIVSAVPMPAQVDQHVNKRAAETHTITHTAWETVDVTTTVYVNDADPTPVQAAAVVETTTTPVPVETPAPATYQQADTVVPSPSVPSSPPGASPTSAAPVADSVNVPRAGQCEGSGSGCSGDITYYNGAGGYGACGSLIDDSNPNVALPHGLMGTQSNGNPYCGRTVSIKGTDGSIHTGTVVDKCMGCEGYSIDLAPGLFSAVAPAGDGRVGDIEWWFS